MYKLDEIARALARATSPRQVERFLRSILTPTEIREISSRWALVRLLDQGASQRSVAKKLGLSLCKITRGSRELKKRRSAFKEMIDTYKKQVKS
jgi:TrpR family transcriptional regulator, trp operon repressor